MSPFPSNAFDKQIFDTVEIPKKRNTPPVLWGLTNILGYGISQIERWTGAHRTLVSRWVHKRRGIPLFMYFVLCYALRNAIKTLRIKSEAAKDKKGEEWEVSENVYFTHRIEAAHNALCVQLDELYANNSKDEILGAIDEANAFLLFRIDKKMRISPNEGGVIDLPIRVIDGSHIVFGDDSPYSLLMD